MRINIENVQLMKSETLTVFIEDKLKKLQSKNAKIIGANVFLKIDNNSTDCNKICEIQISIPGPLLFASSTKPSFEQAVRDTIKQIERQLEKRKKNKLAA